mmetsp:Transcript_51114/g.61523  ORF Transcript_51114/g.61523 Transcript_51114/m.61523 type:complete len:97 (-) Transcript_51114:537-827(-)
MNRNIISRFPLYESVSTPSIPYSLTRATLVLSWYRKKEHDLFSKSIDKPSPGVNSPCRFVGTSHHRLPPSSRGACHAMHSLKAVERKAIWPLNFQK